MSTCVAIFLPWLRRHLVMDRPKTLSGVIAWSRSRFAQCISKREVIPGIALRLLLFSCLGHICRIQLSRARCCSQAPVIGYRKWFKCSTGSRVVGKPFFRTLNFTHIARLQLFNTYSPTLGIIQKFSALLRVPRLNVNGSEDSTAPLPPCRTTVFRQIDSVKHARP